VGIAIDSTLLYFSLGNKNNKTRSEAGAPHARSWPAWLNSRPKIPIRGRGYICLSYTLHTDTPFEVVPYIRSLCEVDGIYGDDINGTTTTVGF